VATDAAAVRRLADLKGIATLRGFVALLSAADHVAPYLAATQVPQALPFLRAVWPAPLSAILPVRPGLPWAVAEGEVWTAAFRVPAHAPLLALLAALGAPLVSTSANRSGEPPLADGGAIADRFGDGLAAVVLEDPSPALAGETALASTLADFTRWPPSMLRAGRFDLMSALAAQAAEAATLQGAAPAGVRILFVCDGNTCRSPLASHLAAVALAARGVESQVGSAGTGALEGAPASAEAVAVAREAGIDLGAHRARRLTREAVLAADLVLCMGESQRRAVHALAPEAGSRVHVLREYATGGGDGRPVEDPFGGGLERYRSALAELRELVTASVRRRLAGI
jgi:protein-tyrosine-phosphatase/tRNA A37 threonylcarbamoyladenosine synthetase subunit TsaC/SUA5/YrdC